MKRKIIRTKIGAWVMGRYLKNLPVHVLECGHEKTIPYGKKSYEYRVCKECKREQETTS